MAEDQSAVDHLLLGRQALQDEITRLSSELDRLGGVVEQLDAVIGQVEGNGGGAYVAPLTRSSNRVTVSAASGQSGPPSSPPAKRAPSRPRKPRGEAPKSIRVHVLEMLAADDREWSLADIIDRIHDAGIQAHDDAVRSITIKLMKDGRVERVGRGQYRLARRGGRSSAPNAPVRYPSEAADVSDDASNAVDDSVTAEPEVSLETVEVLDEIETAGAAEEPAAVEESWSETVTSGEQAPDESAAPESKPNDETPGYTPPLNLGQPWS